MNIKELILKRLNEKGEVRSADIVRLTGFSREYVGRFLRQLQQDGRLVLVGKANQAKYVTASSRKINQAKST